MSERYARQRQLPGYSDESERSLASARVVVVGAGGLGSAVVPLLAGAGVGALHLVDPDRVELSNLHRQLLFSEADLGRAKAEVAAARAVAANSTLRATSAVRRFEPEDLDGATLVIDATDDPVLRHELDALAASRGIPLVWGSALQFRGMVGVATGSSRYRDLYPQAHEPEAENGCAVEGIFAPAVATIGALMAGEALKILADLGTVLQGRVLFFDFAEGTMRTISFGAATTPAEHAA